MTNHVVARQWTGAVLGEQPEVSEIFHDPIKQCFGVYGGPATGVLFYPHLTPAMMNLRETQGLSGKIASDHSENDLALMFNVKDQIQVIQRSTGTVLASFSVNGFVASAGATMGSVRFNFQNLLVNPSLYRNRRNDLVGLPLGPWKIGANTNFNQYLIAPNWLLWQLPGNGNLTAVLNDADLPASAGCRYGVAVTIGAVLPGASALRTFVHKTDDMLNERINASVWTKSPLNATHTMRLVTPDAVFASQTVVGTGNWQRVSFSAIIPVGSARVNNWISFDMMYNPSQPNGVYQFAKPQITLGAGLLPEEKRTGELESALVDAIFWEGKSNILFNQPQYQQFDLAYSGFTYLEGTSASGGVPTGVVLDAQGADYIWSLAGDSGLTHRVMLTAYRAPVVSN